VGVRMVVIVVVIMVMMCVSVMLVIVFITHAFTSCMKLDLRETAPNRAFITCI